MFCVVPQFLPQSSSNGTFVNNKRIGWLDIFCFRNQTLISFVCTHSIVGKEKRQVLLHGDRIGFSGVQKCAMHMISSYLLISSFSLIKFDRSDCFYVFKQFQERCCWWSSISYAKTSWKVILIVCSCVLISVVVFDDFMTAVHGARSSFACTKIRERNSPPKYSVYYFKDGNSCCSGVDICSIWNAVYICLVYSLIHR